MYPGVFIKYSVRRRSIILSSDKFFGNRQGYVITAQPFAVFPSAFFVHLHNAPAISPPFDLLLAAPTHPWARATTHTHHSKREPCTLPSSPERPVNKSTYRVAKSSTRRAPRPLVDGPARYPLHLRTARQRLSTSSSLSPKRSAGVVMADTTPNSSSPPVTLVRVFQSNFTGPPISLYDLIIK